MASRSKKSTFPDKLWKMVNDRRFESAIRWTDNGSSFEIFESELKKLCLGKGNKLFYTEQPKSFVRQLHMYGFRKIKNNQFQHCCFQRNRPHLLKNIKRSYKNYPISKSTDESIEDHQTAAREEYLSALDQTSNSTSKADDKVCDNISPERESYSSYYDAAPSALQPINSDDKEFFNSMTSFSDDQNQWHYEYPNQEQQLSTFYNNGCREETISEYRDESIHYYNDLKPLEYMY